MFHKFFFWCAKEAGKKLLLPFLEKQRSHTGLNWRQWFGNWELGEEGEKKKCQIVEMQSDGISSAAKRVGLQVWGMLALSGTEAGSQAAGLPFSPYIPLHRAHTSMARKVLLCAQS